MRVKDARRSSARAFSVSEEEIYFTSAALNCDNAAIPGGALARKRCEKIITTQVEHPAVLELQKALSHGFKIEYIVDKKCSLIWAGLRQALTEDTVLISVSVNNGRRAR